MKTIGASVGFQGRNFAQDTFVVQKLLNSARARSALPPIKVDGIVGPQTIGAINSFQKSTFGFADGRVDPGGRTLATLNALDSPGNGEGRVRCDAEDLGGGSTPQLVQSRQGFASVRTNLTSAPSLTPRDEALKQKTECLVWIGAALTALQTVRILMQTGRSADLDRLKTLVEFQAINTHFHLDRHPNPLKFLSDLGQNYSFINIAINGADKHFDNDLASDDFANSDPGGFHRRNDPQNPGKIFFCQKYLTMGPLSKVATILHEAGHYIDAKIDHFASSVPFPTGRALVGTQGQARANNYQNMTPDEAFQNAASYAGFAIHCVKRQDTRPVVGQ